MEETTLLEETREANRLLRTQLLWSRVTAVLLAILLLLMLAVLVGISRGISQLPKAFEDIDFAAISEQLEKLDIDALNQTIQTLEGKIDQVDIGLLNEAVANLNEAVNALQSASDAIKAWGENFSRGVAGLFGT